jgi:hypothetical protein
MAKKKNAVVEPEAPAVGVTNPDLLGAAPEKPKRLRFPQGTGWGLATWWASLCMWRQRYNDSLDSTLSDRVTGAVVLEVTCDQAGKNRRARVCGYTDHPISPDDVAALRQARDFETTGSATGRGGPGPEEEDTNATK